MSIEETQHKTTKIEGWLTEAEGILLFEYARNVKPGTAIVEIGSWKGKSTVWLGGGSKEGNCVKVYAIDHHIGSPEHQKEGETISTFEEFKSNISMAGLNEIVVPIVKTSEESVRDFNSPIGLIFIDGAHEYEAVLLDFKLWFPKVVDGGIISVHDTNYVWGGPTKVVKNLIYKSRFFKNIICTDSITLAEKVGNNTIGDCFVNRLKLYKLTYVHFMNIGFTGELYRLSAFLKLKINLYKRLVDFLNTK